MMLEVALGSESNASGSLCMRYRARLGRGRPFQRETARETSPARFRFNATSISLSP